MFIVCRLIRILNVCNINIFTMSTEQYSNFFKYYNLDTIFQNSTSKMLCKYTAVPSNYGIIKTNFVQCMQLASEWSLLNWSEKELKLMTNYLSKVLVVDRTHNFIYFLKIKYFWNTDVLKKCISNFRLYLDIAIYIFI